MRCVFVFFWDGNKDPTNTKASFGEVLAYMLKIPIYTDIAYSYAKQRPSSRIASVDVAYHNYLSYRILSRYLYIRVNSYSSEYYIVRVRSLDIRKGQWSSYMCKRFPIVFGWVTRNNWGVFDTIGHLTLKYFRMGNSYIWATRMRPSTLNTVLQDLNIGLFNIREFFKFENTNFVRTLITSVTG